MTWLYKL